MPIEHQDTGREIAKELDIKFKMPYPANELSNFASHNFVFDDVKCASMEGFLQSLHFNDEKVQAEICQKVGIEARKIGVECLKNWDMETIYWKGQKYNRHSQEYQNLLRRAYDALFFQSESFRKALLATGQKVLKHSIGVSDPKEDILTEIEFCSLLTSLRNSL